MLVFLSAVLCFAGCDLAVLDYVDELKAKTFDKYEEVKTTADTVKQDLEQTKESIENKLNDINTALDEISEAKQAVDQALGDDKSKSEKTSD